MTACAEEVDPSWMSQDDCLSLRRLHGRRLPGLNRNLFCLRNYFVCTIICETKQFWTALVIKFNLITADNRRLRCGRRCLIHRLWGQRGQDFKMRHAHLNNGAGRLQNFLFNTLLSLPRELSVFLVLAHPQSWAAKQMLEQPFNKLQ